MNFAERLKQVRKSTGLNQQDFAHAIGITRNPIAAAETGKSKLYPASIHKICELFGINENWLLHEDGEMKETFGIPEDELKNLTETYAKLPVDSRKKFMDLLSDLVQK